MPSIQSSSFPLVFKLDPGLVLPAPVPVAFCFMTQLGRHAGIVKQDLSSYRIVQDSRFSLLGASGGTGAPASAEALETHVFLDSTADDDANRTLVDMGEQTSYLHASYRGAAKTRLWLVSN